MKFSLVASPLNLDCESFDESLESKNRHFVEFKFKNKSRVFFYFHNENIWQVGLNEKYSSSSSKVQDNGTKYK